MPAARQCRPAQLPATSTLPASAAGLRTRDAEEDALPVKGIAILPGHAHRHEDLIHRADTVQYTIDVELEQALEDVQDVFNIGLAQWAALTLRHHDKVGLERAGDQPLVRGTARAVYIRSGQWRILTSHQLRMRHHAGRTHVTTRSPGNVDPTIANSSRDSSMSVPVSSAAK